MPCSYIILYNSAQYYYGVLAKEEIIILAESITSCAMVFIFDGRSEHIARV